MKRVLSLAVLASAMAVLLFAGCPAQKGDIKIGAVLPLTGGAAQYGQNAKNAIALAAKETNAAGGVRGRRLEVKFEDSQSSPQQAATAITKLITADKVPAVIGDMPSSATLAAAPIAEKNKVVLISPASSNPTITSAGDYIFRTCVSDVFEAGYLAAVARETLGLSRVAILSMKNDYGEGVRSEFRRRFVEIGGEVVAEEQFDVDAIDYRSQLAKLTRALGPDGGSGVLLVGYKEMIPALRQIREMGMPYQILSTVMFDDPEIPAKAGNAAEGVVFTAWRMDMRRDEAKRFEEAYRAEYGAEPGVFAPEAYDALRLIADAVARGGSGSAAIQKYLYGVKDYAGASGVMAFDTNGDVMKPLTLMTVKQGQFVQYSQ